VGVPPQACPAGQGDEHVPCIATPKDKELDAPHPSLPVGCARCRRPHRRRRAAAATPVAVRADRRITAPVARGGPPT
jgi:hypothetical protein